MTARLTAETRSRGIIPSVRTIAVLRANAIGDFIVSLPALAALRAAYPSAEITLLGNPWHADFLRGRLGPVDRVVAVPPYGGVSAPQGTPQHSTELDRFFAARQAEQIDLALQLQGGGRNSNPFVRRLGAALTVGARTPDAPPLDRWIPYDRWQHEVLRGLEIVALVGAVSADLEPHLAVTSADLRESCLLLPDPSRPFIAIHPGATNPERWWPAARFAALADALISAGACVVLVGSEDDRGQVEKVKSAMAKTPIDLRGRLSLGGLAGLLSRCRLMVANDSGPLHVAQAVGTPTVGIYSFFNLMNFGPLTRARHQPVVSQRQSPGACAAHCGACDECRSYLTDIPVDDVLTAAMALWQAAGNFSTHQHR